jgi:hypothetical protein
MAAIGKKYNVAERDAKNRRLHETVFLTVSNSRIRAANHCDITPCRHVTVPLLAPKHAKQTQNRLKHGLRIVFAALCFRASGKGPLRGPILSPAHI